MKPAPRMRAIALVMTAVLCACASPQSERAQLAQQALIGMPKAQLLSCAGVPDRSRTEASAEFFTYETNRLYGSGGSTVGAFAGSGRVGTGLSVPLATEVQSEICEATFTLEQGRVVALVYNSNRAGRYAECVRMIDSCLAFATRPDEN